MRNRSLPKSLGVVLTLSIIAGCGGDAEEAPPPPASQPAAPAGPATPAPGPAADLPAGLTPEMVSQGQQVYAGQGICFTCHGSEGQGTPLGPNLADDEWIWIDNPEQDLHGKLVEQIRAGTPQPREFPAPMPPMGGATLTDEQLQAVAAYVVSL